MRMGRFPILCRVRGTATDTVILTAASSQIQEGDMRTNRFVVAALAALAILVSAACGSAPRNPLEPQGPGDVKGINQPPDVVATVSPTVYDGDLSGGTYPPKIPPDSVSATKIEFTIRVGQRFGFKTNVFNPQATGRRLSLKLDEGDGRPSLQEFDEPQREANVGQGSDLAHFDTPGDRIYRHTGLETGGNLPQPTVLDIDIVLHVVR